MNTLISIQLFLRKSFQVFESLIKIVFLSKFQKHKWPATSTEACIILANGPSLLKDIQSNPGLMPGKNLLCVNHFPTTDLFEKFKPSYYVTSVPELWLPDVNQKYADQREALLTSFTAKTTWPLTIFLPFESRVNKEWRGRLKANPNITLKYFNNVPIEGFRWFSFLCFKRGLGMPRPHNVLVPSLMVALNLGYKKIFLFGVDHSWLPEISVTETNEVLINQKHFYDDGRSKGAPMDMRGKGKRNLGEVLHKFMHAFSSYYIVKEYADYRKTTIINCTKHSFIDAFERYSPQD